MANRQTCVKIYSPIWGDKHINLLENALGRSLSWPKNKEAIRGSKWIITTDSQESVEKIGDKLKKIDPEYKGFFFIAPHLTHPNIDVGMVLIETLKASVHECLKDNEPMLMATPDFIYGDGTIDAFKRIADGKGECATIAHMRVLPDIVDELPAAGPSNPRLMNMAFHRPHISWSDSDNRLHKSGLKKWEISKWNYAVQHYMPSPFYYNFLEEDLDHFTNYIDEWRPPGFGCIDHTWPSLLLRSKRLKFIASSDIAMMIEVTDKDANVPPLNQPGEEGFFHKKFHNDIQSQVISCFRGTE